MGCRWNQKVRGNGKCIVIIEEVKLEKGRYSVSVAVRAGREEEAQNLDNDGMDKQMLNDLSYYGIIVVDSKDNALYVLTEGNGTAAFCSYFEEEVYIAILHMCVVT